MTKGAFYTYAYLGDDGKPYYIGKGKKNRAYSRHHNVETPEPEQILLLKTGLTEEEAIKHEEYMIAVYGRKCNNSGILENELTRGFSVSACYHKYRKEDPDYWSDELLSSLFGNRTAACVLLFIDRENEAHASGIANAFGFGLNQTQRQLRKLEEAYVLRSRRIGILRLYSFNERNPTVRNLRNFLGQHRKTLSL